MRRLDLVPSGRIGQQQDVIAHLIDQPRHAVGGLGNALTRFRGEYLRAGTAGRRNPRVDVVLGLGSLKRFEIASGRQALAERFELRAGKPLFQSAISGKHQTHGRLAAADQIGQRSKFIEHS